MCEVARDELRSVEVLEWKGVHAVLDYKSVCSQKVLCALMMKRVPFTYKKVELMTRENRGEFFMGLNPRGVVPVLVHDGRVFIESVEIVKYIDRTFDGPSIYPEKHRASIDKLLQWEDDLHLDRRNFTHGGYMIPPAVNLNVHYTPAKLKEWLIDSGPDVRSAKNVSQGKKEQYKFWMEMYKAGGATPEMLRTSAKKWGGFYSHVNRELEGKNFILGGEEATLADVTAVITVHRMAAAGYPFHRLTNIVRWYKHMKTVRGCQVIYLHLVQPMGLSFPFSCFHTYMYLAGRRAIDVIEPENTPPLLTRLGPICTCFGFYTVLLAPQLPLPYWLAVVFFVPLAVLIFFARVKLFGVPMFHPHLREMEYDVESTFATVELKQKMLTPSYIGTLQYSTLDEAAYRRIFQ